MQEPTNTNFSSKSIPDPNTDTGRIQEEKLAFMVDCWSCLIIHPYSHYFGVVVSSTQQKKTQKQVNTYRK